MKAKTFRLRHGAGRDYVKNDKSQKWRVRKGAELLTSEDKPEKFSVEEENGGGHNPCDDYCDAGIGEFAHFAAIPSELN
jgi:hypothetical protein